MEAEELGISTRNPDSSEVGEATGASGAQASMVRFRQSSVLSPRLLGDFSPRSGRQNMSLLPAKITVDTNIGGAVNDDTSELVTVGRLCLQIHGLTTNGLSNIHMPGWT